MRPPSLKVGGRGAKERHTPRRGRCRSSTGCRRCAAGRPGGERGAVGCVLRQGHAARVCGGGGGEGEGEGDGDTGNGARSEGACVWRPG